MEVTRGQLRLFLFVYMYIRMRERETCEASKGHTRLLKRKSGGR